MLPQQLLLIALLPLIQAQETVLGAYIFHRHGDRTAKSWTPVNLTSLGYKQVYDAGSFFNARYVSSSSAKKIYGISSTTAKLSQLSIQAPVDNTLQTSAQGWLQGLYPATGAPSDVSILANGSSVTAPLNGYQLIPVNQVTSLGATTSTSENSAWLQGSSGCQNAIISSNNYYVSADYQNTLASTAKFYQSILPVINGTFTSATDTYKNAYTIYDLVHVATIHNTSISSSSLLTADTILQLQTRADQHEYNLAYNASDSIRAIAGATLAAQIVQALNTTITGQSASKLNAQFGAYASFLSFFGLAQLPAVSTNFTGIVDYASAMVFELVTNASVSASSYPTADQISVRFLFTNGSAAYNPLAEYPLFGQAQSPLPWTTFVSSMNQFAIGEQGTWCTACGNTTGTCAAYATSTASSGSSSSASNGSSSESTSGSGLSTAVAGVIGAMVTLAVILGLEALVLLLGGMRIISKKSLAHRPISTEVVNAGKA